MEKFAQQFLFLSRKLWVELREIKERIQKHADAIGKHQTALETSVHAPPILKAEIQIPEALVAQIKAPNVESVNRENLRVKVEVATLVVVFLYATVATFQWWETRKAANAARDSVDLARETRTLDLRAWVGIKKFTFESPKANKPLTVRMLITNSGKTVGIFKTSAATIYPSFEDDIDRFVSSGEWKNTAKERFLSPPDGAPVFPNSEFTWQLISRGPVTPEQEQSIKKGRIFIYVVGEFEYTDVFKESHSNGFCAKYNPSFDRLEMCKGHNWAN